MAEIVLLAGTCHGPLLELTPDFWVIRAEDEMRSPARMLNTRDGRFLTYPELLAEVGDRYSAKNTLAVFTQQAATSQAALDRLAANLRAAQPDAVVLIGNDQDELFSSASIPAFAVYHGAEVRTHKRDTSKFPEWRKRVSRGYGMDRVRTYPGAPDLAKGIIGSLMRADFDVTACGDVPEPEKLGFGHAYGFVCERLFGGAPPPLVPVLVNTYTPLNRPSPRRCVAFGRALRAAIESAPQPLKVAVIASGGLSHFLCEEDMDREILAALETGDTEALAALPEAALSSGSSEIRSWIVLSGLLDGFRMQWNEYVPVHRTPPGSGIGMGWAVWQ
jgi:hypothetical protein